MNITYETLLSSIQNAAGIRLRLRLQPMYGPGEIIFPSTVAGGKYLISKRRIPGYLESPDCAILDSVQSQANRMEDALRKDLEAGNIFLPHVETDFSDVKDLAKIVGKITCFDAPHRIFDAILRDSVDETGNHFPFTEAGKAAILACSANATAIFEISPASLLLGSWDSTGITGGLGEKYTRCVVSELTGINCREADRAGTRIDPLNAEKNQNPSKILDKNEDKLWSQLKQSRKKFDKPSEINHSSVPWGGDNATHGGITCDYIQQSTTISFPALRQLRFPVKGKDVADTSTKAQAVLSAIALHAIALNVERGWHLRSRCDLILDSGQAVQWEILGTSSAPQNFTIDASQTRKVLLAAIKAAVDSGLPWRQEPIRLKPSSALATLVVASQKAHRESTTEA